MRQFLLLFILALSFVFILTQRTSYAKELRPYKNFFGKESTSCQKMKEILTDQIGKTVTILLKGTDTVLVGSVVSIDRDIVRVDIGVSPEDEQLDFFIPVCTIGAVGIPK